mgnify:FL=1
MFLHYNRTWESRDSDAESNEAENRREYYMHKVIEDCPTDDVVMEACAGRADDYDYVLGMLNDAADRSRKA